MTTSEATTDRKVLPNTANRQRQMRCRFFIESFIRELHVTTKSSLPRNRTPLLVAVLAITTCAMLPAAAQTTGAAPSNNPFSFELSAGYRYNSRLAVPDLDLSSDVGDSAFLLKAGVDFDVDFTDRTSFSAGYTYSQSQYQDQKAFDIDSHIGSLQLKHDFGPFDGGLSYHQAQSDLDGRDYLDYRRLSAFARGRLGDRVILRGGYVHTEKEFNAEVRTQAVDRDATVDGFAADVYFLLDGTSTFLSAGYLYEDNDARGDAFDFNANSYTLGFTHNFSIAGRDSRFKAGYRHEQRDYDSITPSIGVVRDDTRNSFDAELRVDLTRHVFASLTHEVNDHSSNLPAADYSQNVTNLWVGLIF